MKYLWDKIVSLAGSNFGLKVLAIVIAVGLWVAGHRDVERAVEVPVEFRNIPSDLMVLDNRVDYVVLRLTGPRTLVSTLDAGDLKLGLDLDGAKAGSVSYPLRPSSFSIPRGVTIARITPPGRSFAVGTDPQAGAAGDGAFCQQTSCRPEDRRNIGGA